MKKACVLIVDDKPEGLFALEAVLSTYSHSYDLKTATSGLETIEQVKKNSFAVILLDVQMPGMDGFETARRLREINRHVPIIFITAISHDDIHVFQGYDSGAVDYLFKPLNSRVLTSKINIFVDLFYKEQTLQEQAEYIRRHEQEEHQREMKNLADAVPHLIFRTNIEDSATYFNEGWTQYTGLSQENSCGIGWQSVFNPQGLTHVLELWNEMKSSGASFEWETMIRGKSAPAGRWFLVRGVPNRNLKGDAVGWLFSCTDIHNSKAVLSQLEDRTRELERSNKELEQFAYVTSHDLQEPLRTVTSYVDLLQMYTDGTLNEKASRCLQPIVKGVKRMQRLISDLLNYSRVAKGDSGNVGSINIQSEVMAAIEAIPQAKEAQIDIESMPEVYGNSFQVQQLFQNLISNAVKFKRTDPVHIKVGAQRRGNSWVFFVKDNGIGISKEYREKIFVIFQRLHNRDKYPGTGIGLAICKKIVETAGGKIWVESEPGKGTTFYFTLPTVEEKEVALLV